MKYEFGKPSWIEVTPENEIPEPDIERVHTDIEERIKSSIERLIQSQENFLGRGLTAEVHFLEADRKLCYKIIRKVDVMARPDAVGNLPERYRAIHEAKKSKEGKTSTFGSKDAALEIQKMWHVDLFTEAEYLSRAREISVGTSVKIPRPDARISIQGKESGDGYEVADDFEVLLMETMDAISVEDLIRTGESLPKNFNYEQFCKDADEFIAKMHEGKLYHRDLHAGNVMIDRTTGSPVIIDFGRSTLSSEEDAYTEEFRPGEKIPFIRDEQLFRDKVKIPLGEYARSIS